MNDAEKSTIKLNISSFRVKVIMALVLSIFILVALSGFLLNKLALDGQIQQLRNQLMTIAQIAAISVDGDLLKQIPLNKKGVDTASYKRLEKHLKRMLRANLEVTDIYILTRTEQKGIWQFVVDTETPTTSKGRPGATYPGDHYNVARFPQMLRGYDGPAADEHIEVDEWGAAMSGYAPVRDDQGKTVAVLGVDVSAGVLLETERNLHRHIWRILCVGLLVSVLLGILLSVRISRPITQLLEGTRHLAIGDMQYRVDIKGKDEIGQLAQAFNLMADKLLEAQRKLKDYFIRIVQSLALSLEAKDEYTGGHSMRVAEYAERIATRIGFPAEKVSELKEAALLHDIGKLGVPEHILNKKGPLSLQEQGDIMHNHPVVGGKILKPVFLDDEMLTVVTGHHERYDGTGYPDGLAGEQISIYARITAVADTYDAMTSSRSYRPDMGKEWAIRELEKAKGTQLDPHLVDVFIEILQEESSHAVTESLT